MERDDESALASCNISIILDSANRARAFQIFIALPVDRCVCDYLMSDRYRCLNLRIVNRTIGSHASYRLLNIHGTFALKTFGNVTLSTAHSGIICVRVRQILY